MLKRALWAACGLVLAAGPAAAADPLKIGVIAPFSGPYADYGKEIEAGMRAWMRRNGDTVAGRKVELLVRDTTGPVPEVAKRLAQELLVREKVDFLAGFGFSPEALAVADLATQSKRPMIIMNAASSIITTKSPYIVRLSMTLPQGAAPLATWAAKAGIKKVFTLVADYAPGIDSEAAFKKAFTAAGGQIVDGVRAPLRNPDMAPFLQRIKDVKPEAVFVFVPPGEMSIAFLKGFQERGLGQAGIRVIATGDLTDDHLIDASGDVALGIVTCHHYSAAHDSAENRAFLEAYQAVSGGLGRANFMAVGGYDGMAAIYEVARKLDGKIDADKAIEVLKGWKRESPRGPIQIDPETRDIVQTEYIRKVERRPDGKLYNVEFEQIPNVKDPGK
jgi:branched-chain amino acid transport system substrate-binding protein